MRPKVSGDHFANLLQQSRRLLAHVAVLDGTTAVLVNVPQRLYGKIAKHRTTVLVLFFRQLESQCRR
jgi:hypothetical protein